MELEKGRNWEIVWLRIWSAVSLFWLSLTLLFSLGNVAYILAAGKIIFLSKGPPDQMLYVILCITGGMLGSSISAIMSIVNKIACGWELSNGENFPVSKHKDSSEAGISEDAKKDMGPELRRRFSAKIIPFFLIRPFLGAIMGLMIYVGLVSGFLTMTEQTGKAALLSFEKLTFFSILGGLFAKTLLNKLKQVFKTMLGVK